MNNLTVSGNYNEIVSSNKTVEVVSNVVETVTGKYEKHIYSSQPSKIETLGDITIQTSQGTKDIKLSTIGTGKVRITNTTNISSTNNVLRDSRKFNSRWRSLYKKMLG